MKRPSTMVGRALRASRLRFVGATKPAWIVLLACADGYVVLGVALGFTLTGGVALRSGQLVAAELGAS